MSMTLTEMSVSNMYLTVMSRYCLKLYFISFLEENKCIIFFSSRLCQFLKVLDLKGKS